jgi:hypothetical protein
LVVVVEVEVGVVLIVDDDVEEARLGYLYFECACWECDVLLREDARLDMSRT